MDNLINDKLNEFLNLDQQKNSIDNEETKTVCDAQTGECYVIKTKDGIIERLNKQYITEDGRQLLHD